MYAVELTQYWLHAEGCSELCCSVKDSLTERDFPIVKSTSLKETVRRAIGICHPPSLTTGGWKLLGIVPYLCFSNQFPICFGPIDQPLRRAKQAPSKICNFVFDARRHLREKLTNQQAVSLEIFERR